MQSLGLVGFLCYFATPDLVPQVIQTMFEKNFHQQQTRANTNVTTEYTNLLQNVYESITRTVRSAAIEDSESTTGALFVLGHRADLVPEAKSASTNNIFHLFAYNGGMDANNIVKYFDKVTNHTTLCPLQIDSQHPRPFQHHC